MAIAHLFASPQRGAPQQALAALQLLAGQGVSGDRHCGRSDWPGQQVTLVEAEEIEAFCTATGQALDWALTRRNVVTRGVRLNALVGQRFRLGECELLGVELCEPCRSLGRRLENAAMSAPEVVRYWLGRGGLRADVLVGGRVRLGDALVHLEAGK